MDWSLPTPQKWQQTLKQIQQLRLENRHLKHQLEELQNIHQEYPDMIRSTMVPGRISETSKPIKKKCEHCGVGTPEKSRKQVVEEFQLWSHRLNSTFIKKHLLEKNPKEAMKQQELQKKDEKGLSLIENVCLYGPKQEEMMMVEKHSRVPHQLYYPKKHPDLQVYGNYLYPEDVPFRAVREEKKDIEIDKILFRKSLRSQDCQIFIFCCREEDQTGLTASHPMLKYLNPFQSLYGIALHFSDYLFVQQPYSNPDFSLDRLGSMVDATEDLSPKKQQMSPKSALPRKFKTSKSYGDTTVFKSTFCLCLMSYLPFVDFFCRLLARIIDQIKIRRMERHAKEERRHARLDISYVAQELGVILGELRPQLQSFIVKMGSVFELSLRQHSLALSLQGAKLRQNLQWEWSYRTLRLLDKDSLYQIYCLVMLQESVIFISENGHQLTFLIFLFTVLLPRPFAYPHPIVSMVFSEDLLQSPFTTVQGINKGSRWIEENDILVDERMSGKVIVNCNQGEIKIKNRNKSKIPKSERLKKIFAGFFKRMEKGEGGGRRRELNRQVSRGENDLVLGLLQELEEYYQEQLFGYMPNREIIESIRSSVMGDNPTAVSSKLIRCVEQYMMEMRRGRSRGKQTDPVVDLLMQKQIFYVYLTHHYQI